MLSSSTDWLMNIVMGLSSYRFRHGFQVSGNLSQDQPESHETALKKFLNVSELALDRGSTSRLRRRSASKCQRRRFVERDLCGCGRALALNVRRLDDRSPPGNFFCTSAVSDCGPRAAFGGMSPPIPSKRLRTLGASNALSILSLSWSRTACRVPFGANNANQGDARNSGSPAPLEVGTFGMAGLRSAVPSAYALSVPA